MPKKPSPPIGHVVFRGKGRGTEYVVEHLCTDKQQLEQQICKKFVECLRRQGRTVSDPSPDSTGSHDAFYTEDGHLVCVELTEVICPRHAEIRSLRGQYTDRVSDALDSARADLNGLKIELELVDEYQFDRWPKAGSRRGREILHRFKEELLAMRQKLIGLPQGHFDSKRWTVGRDKLRCGFMATRVAPAGSGIRPEFRCSEVIGYTTEEIHELLPTAIGKKINKNYSPQADGKLILLVYQVLGSPLAEHHEPEPFVRARELLNGVSHPFDEVWYLFPMAGDAHGCVSLVWQRT